MNSFTAIGNIGQDPELRTTGSGKSVLNLKLAVDRYYSVTDHNGNRVSKKDTDWIPVVLWGPQAERCAVHLQKGSRVGITGSLRSRQWTDREGHQHYGMEVVVDRIDFLNNIRSTRVVESTEEAYEATA